MTCTEARELLVRYDDGELGGGEAAAVAEHLTGCTGCSGELSALRGAMRMVGDYLAGPKPVESAARPPAVRVARRPLAPMLAAAAGLLLAGAVGWVAFRPAPAANAAEIARRALAMLETHRNVRYRIEYLLEGGKVKPAGEMVVEPGGRSLMRYTYSGIEFLMGYDGERHWTGTVSYPGDPGSFTSFPSDAEHDNTIVDQGRVPDFEAWIKDLKEDGSRLIMLPGENVDGRKCRVIRSAPTADFPMDASVTYWVDEDDGSIRRAEDRIPGFMHLRLALDATDVPVPKDFYSLRGHSTEKSRLTELPAKETKDPAGQ